MTLPALPAALKEGIRHALTAAKPAIRRGFRTFCQTLGGVVAVSATEGLQAVDWPLALSAAAAAGLAAILMNLGDRG